MQKSALGFTLIELLVVIAIMAVISIYTLSNYRSFGEDQKLKNATLDIQSLLRQAQTNATSNSQCGINQFGAIWRVEVADPTTFNLICSLSPNIQKTLQLTLNNNKLIVLSGDDASCPVMPFTISFAPIDGTITLGEEECTSLTFTLENTVSGNRKDLTIDKGGRIYAE